MDNASDSNRPEPTKGLKRGVKSGIRSGLIAALIIVVVIGGVLFWFYDLAG